MLIVKTMLRILGWLFVAAASSCSVAHTNTKGPEADAVAVFYVVRHAEKEAQVPNMSTDVPLSASGRARAEALKERLRHEKISAVYSTQTIRTKSTATPFSELAGLDIQIYDHRDTAMLSRWKKGSGNTLIVGHSNTVDDIVNFLAGKTLLQDLPDSAYGDLFILVKKGNNVALQKERFGK
jgi:phosphohistidine phosphatase SixA